MNALFPIIKELKKIYVQGTQDYIYKNSLQVSNIYSIDLTVLLYQN